MAFLKIEIDQLPDRFLDRDQFQTDKTQLAEEFRQRIAKNQNIHIAIKSHHICSPMLRVVRESEFKFKLNYVSSKRERHTHLNCRDNENMFVD